MGGGSRESKDIWWHLFGINSHNGRWRGWRLLERSFWVYGSNYADLRWWERMWYFEPYIWHDSVGQYLWRVWCKLNGHHLALLGEAEDGEYHYFCLRCHNRKIVPRHVDIPEFLRRQKND